MLLLPSDIAFVYSKQEGLSVASIARDDPSPLPGVHHDPLHFRHRQTDTDIVA